MCIFPGSCLIVSRPLAPEFRDRGNYTIILPTPFRPAGATRTRTRLFTDSLTHSLTHAPIRILLNSHELLQKHLFRVDSFLFVDFVDSLTCTHACPNPNPVEQP